MEDERTARECHVDCQCQVVEPMPVKAEIPLHWENVQVSVDKAEERQEAECLVQINRVLLGEELLDHVLAAATEGLLVFNINLKL